MTCLLILLLSAVARGDGSIAFNGSSSKLQHDLANVLDGSDEITVCVWVNSAASNDGYVLLFDEAGSGLNFHHPASSNTLAWLAGFAPGFRQWSFPATDGAWHAVSIKYNRSNYTNTPEIRVDFTLVTLTPSGTGTGSPSTVDNGYSVGSGWEGKIAHLQVFNRLLSEAEQEACLRAPGSVPKGLRLWLPMTNGIDILDRSGNGNHATATDVTTGSDGPKLVLRPGESLAVAQVRAGYHKLNQHVIPRFADGTNHPAGQLRGTGAASVIQGTNYGAENGTDPQAIVVTEDYIEDEMDHWTNGSLATPAVLQAEVRDLTILGRDDANGYSDAGAVRDLPALNPVSSFKNRETGLFIQSAGALIDNVRFFHIAGTCCYIKNPAGLNHRVVPYQPFDREKTKVRDVWCLRAYSGIEVQQIDTVLGNIVCRDLRDWGVKLSVGATQIDGPIHVFGISSGPAYYGGATSASPAVWFNTNTADRCWGGPWYVETSDIGMKIDSNGNVLGPIYSHHCMHGNIQVLKTYNTIRDFEITPITESNWLEEGTVDGVGASTIQLDTENTFVSGGLNGLRVVITSDTGAGQSRDITGYDGASDTATVSPPWNIQPPVGSTYVIRQAPVIDIAAQENTVLNGRIGAGGPVPDGTVAIRIKGTNVGQRQVIRDVLLFGTTCCCLEQPTRPRH
jgi:hypothetical protein